MVIWEADMIAVRARSNREAGETKTKGQGKLLRRSRAVGHKRSFRGRIESLKTVYLRMHTTEHLPFALILHWLRVIQRYYSPSALVCVLDGILKDSQSTDLEGPGAVAWGKMLSTPSKSKKPLNRSDSRAKAGIWQEARGNEHGHLG